MPVIVELALKGTWPLRADTAQLHGLTCALFEGEGADHFGHDKPFTVWPLRKAAEGSSHDWEYRAAWLPSASPPSAALAPERLRHGHVNCSVLETRLRTVSYAQLAGGSLLGAAKVIFRSPAYFSQNGGAVVLPDPRLIVGSWRRRWNAYVPAGELAIADDMWRDTHRALSLVDYDLRTERLESGYQRLQAGMVGWLTIKARKGGQKASRVLSTLARFAEFCGTGAMTAHGFGATTAGPAD